MRLGKHNMRFGSYLVSIKKTDSCKYEARKNAIRISKMFNIKKIDISTLAHIVRKAW